MASGLPRGDPVLKSWKWYRSLASAEVRRAEGLFLIEGRRAIEQIAASSSESIAEILLAGTAEPPPQCRRMPVCRLTERQMQAICRSRSPQGIAACVKIPPGVHEPRLPRTVGPRILLLEDIQDPGNTGTLIRTAAAFGFDGVLMSGQCADPFAPKAVQASAGAVLSVWLRRTAAYRDCAIELKKRGFSLIAAVLNGRPPDPAAVSGPLVLALGNEGNGLTDALLSLADRAVTIPVRTRRAESLNVASAGAICMFLFGAPPAR
jgi:TrmH family RNA methyltransferase